MELQRIMVLSSSSFWQSSSQVWYKKHPWNNCRLRQVLHHCPSLWLSFWMPSSPIYSVQGCICEEGLAVSGSCKSSLRGFWFRVDGGCKFLVWFSKSFIPAVSHLLETGPVVLFVDGHHSHITLELIEYAGGRGVHLYWLPPNCTHILQPLDVGTFGPLKFEWRKILQEYRLQTKATNVERHNFVELIAKLWQRAFTPKHVQAGFLGTRLYSFNPSAIHAEQLAPSLLYCLC